MDIALVNLTSPIVLFFVLGLLITIFKAKVKFPSAISDFFTIYLLIAIGFKGGVAIAKSGLGEILFVILGALAVGLIIPVYSFFILWRLGKMRSDDAAAIAGHYGSVSVVTFMAATAFLSSLQISYEGYINGLPALMEIPAIVVALVLASWFKEKNKEETNGDVMSLGQVTKGVVLSKSVVLLVGALLVGYISGPKGMESVGFFYGDIFAGILSLFMLEMGIIAAGKLEDLKKAGVFLVIFALLIPPINALLGIVIGISVGLDVGGSTLLGVLAASSSYIVAPASMRVSLPTANPALYLGASLGITLPFNLIVGIPFYYFMAKYLISI